uniref:Methyltransferase FkbM domain-containing protein n=1 Tax=Panagrolaimus davidi TaxID=227884 RepID=A0A914QIH2_9BILA
MDEHPTSWWIHISKTVQECAKHLVNYIPHIVGTPNMAEHKYYMVPRSPYINDTCSVITFGIGGDISSEEHIRRALPTCTFLGFDPNSDYKSLFTNVLGGKYVQAAVAGKTGVNTIMQLGKSDYGAVGKTPVKSVAELIETHHGKDDIIDILNIDVEGYEYSIFDSMLTEKIFHNVCQFNVEIHPPWFHDTGYSYYDVIKVFRKLIQEGTFVWVQSTKHSDQFYPSYFVNVKNNICIEKYLKGRLF